MLLIIIMRISVKPQKQYPKIFEWYISAGTEPELIIEIMEYAVQKGFKNWEYINGYIKECSKNGITTLKELLLPMA